MPAPPHFITGGELDADRLARLLAHAAELKAAPLSRHAALIGLRTGEAEHGGLAEHASVPVVNMLSPLHHPCQALADLQTLAEAHGSLEGRVVTHVGDGDGDGDDVARPLAVVGALAGVEVRVAAPSGYRLPAGETPAVRFEDPAEAAQKGLLESLVSSDWQDG